MAEKGIALSIRVTCSCGLTNMAIYNECEQVFTCSGWQFRTRESDKTDLPLGWYCGEDGCYQLPVK